jgi:hypothetical protein
MIALDEEWQIKQIAISEYIPTISIGTNLGNTRKFTQATKK